MKKRTLLIPLFILAVLLSACGAAQATPDPATGFDPADSQMPLSSQLMIGSLKLAGTDQQITAEQAASLIPLWKLLKTLSASDTAAPQEIEALTQQINDSMTREQLDAITAMALTQQDIFTLMQDLGIQPEFQGSGSGTGEGFIAPGAGDEGSVPVPPAGGGFEGNPGGGPGGGFGGGPGGGGGQNLTPEQIATAQAMRAERGGLPGGARLNSALLDALISYLEKLAQP